LESSVQTQVKAGRKYPTFPAINGLPGLKLAAVGTSDEQSAREAAEAFGADRWFSDPLAMIWDDRIDLITISVKVPSQLSTEVCAT
jgi:predicted dehydrogenase